MNGVVVIGGGPAGCAAALCLHAQGIAPVTVVEAGRHDRQRIGESVPPDIGLLFARCNILKAFLAEGHQPCLGSGSAWGSDTLGFNDFIANPHGHGWHLDRRRFEAFLAGQVRDRGMRMLTGTRLRGAERAEVGGFRVTVEGPDRTFRHLKAEWLIDAGGIQALLSIRLGARRRTLDRLVAACAFLDLRQGGAFSGLTLLEAVEYGWWYAARLPGGRIVVAVASDAPILKSMGLDKPEAWLRHLRRTRHLHPALHDAGWPERRLSILLAGSSILEPCAGAGWLAVGDAASCYDPICAQGIYKAFADGAAAAAAIANQGNGPVDAVDSYQKRIRDRFSDYLRNRRYFYDLEQRWPSAAFWRSRRGAPAS